MVIGIYVPAGIGTLHLPAAEVLLVAAGIFVARLLAAVVGTWTALLPLALLQRWDAPTFWVKYYPFAIFVVVATAQIFVALDVERLVAYGAPAIIAACCFEAETLAQRWRTSRWMIWLPVLAVLAAVWLPYAGWPTPANAYVSLWLLGWPYWLLSVGIAILAAYVVIGRRWRMRVWREA